jgi:hypothetical protein
LICFIERMRTGKRWWAMSSFVRSLGRLSLAASLAAYVASTLLALLITVEAVQRLGAVVLERLAPTADSPRQMPEKAASAAGIAAPLIGREAAMTLLQDRWPGRARTLWPGAPPQFGRSSRNVSRSPGGPPWGDDDDEDRPAVSGTYRSVCVRLCDGYFFPVSFAVTSDRLERDAKVCASRCGSQGRLFVHDNPGGSPETMVDLAGRPYQQLKTAFLYRTEYVPSCTCQAHPWEAASLERHRAYALARDATKGNKDAQKELQALRVKQRQEGAPDRPGIAAAPAPGADARSAAAALPRGDGEGVMRLGGSENPKPRPEPVPQPVPRSDPDWMRRAFSPR